MLYRSANQYMTTTQPGDSNWGPKGEGKASTCMHTCFYTGKYSPVVFLYFSNLIMLILSFLLNVVSVFIRTGDTLGSLGDQRDE